MTDSNMTRMCWNRSLASLQETSWLEVQVGKNGSVNNFVVQFFKVLSKDLGPLQKISQN
jgi:hypothetical protein